MRNLSQNLKYMPDISTLSRIPLFRNLGNAYWVQLEQSLHRRLFPAGSILMNAGQTGESIFFLLSGTVKVHAVQESGADVTIAILGPGDVVGEVSLLTRAGRSASVVVLEPSELLWMDNAAFQRHLANIPALSYNLACLLAERLCRANENIQALAAHDAEHRIAACLLSFADRYGIVQTNGDINIPLRLTQGDIASLVGASREHTNKILVSYKERGYLSVSQRHCLTIHNQKALARRCGGSAFALSSEEIYKQ